MVVLLQIKRHIQDILMLLRMALLIPKYQEVILKQINHFIKKIQKKERRMIKIFFIILLSNLNLKELKMPKIVLIKWFYSK